MKNYQSTDDFRMARSAERLRTFLADCPNVAPLLESECYLMVAAIVRRYGTEHVRNWLDALLDEAADELTRTPSTQGDE